MRPITRRCYQEGNACVGAECLCLTSDLHENTDKRVLPSYMDLAKHNRSRWVYSYVQSDALEQSFRRRLCLKVPLSWLFNDYRVRALLVAALYIDLCPLTSLTVSTRCWHRVDIALTSCLHHVYTVLTSCLHRVYTLLTSCLHRVVMVLPPWHHSCNNGNCACYRLLHRNYFVPK